MRTEEIPAFRQLIQTILNLGLVERLVMKLRGDAAQQVNMSIVGVDELGVLVRFPFSSVEEYTIRSD